MILVDGGYMSWLYGTDSFGHNGWTSEGRRKYSRNAGCAMLLDSDSSLRKEFWSLYKSGRKDKREKDPEKQKKWESVHRFANEVIKVDPSLATVSFPGLEADDLVATVIQARMIPLPVRVIGVDKDLLQFPRGTCVIERTNGERATINKYAGSHPKAVQPLIRHPMHVLLSLCLMGDKSDSIPRLIPARRLDIMSGIMSSDRPFKTAYETFGEEFTRNLYLAVLPSPWCFDPQPDPLTVLNLVSSGIWWELPIRSDLRENLQAVLDTVVEEDPDDTW